MTRHERRFESCVSKGKMEYRPICACSRHWSSCFLSKSTSKRYREKNVKQDTNYKDVEIVTLVNDGKFMRYAVNYPLFHQKELDDKIQSYANSALEHFKKHSVKQRILMKINAMN